MIDIALLADAAVPTCGAGSCPPHAIVALAGAVAVGFIAGFFTGRRGMSAGKKGAASKKQAQAAQQPRRAIRPSEPRVPIPAGSVEIYVGNLSYDMTEEELRKTFEAFGTVSSARVVTNRFNNKSKGFGFVVMPNRPEAEKAIAAMSEKEVMGRKMRVNEAQNTLKADA